MRKLAFAAVALVACSNGDSDSKTNTSNATGTPTASASSTEKAPPPASSTNADFDAGLPTTCDPGPAGQIYAYNAMNLAGTEQVPLCRYRNKVVMIVNVASKCGNTPQYTPLQAFYEKYRDKGFYILAFPCNQFGGQEPGGATEINECLTKYKVTFPVFEKIEVNGTNSHPLYQWLKAQPGGAGDIEWNFVKFLIGRDGKLIKRWADEVLNSSADQPQVDQAIAAAVAQ